MLYIEIIDANVVRFGSTLVDSGEDRYLPTSMEARKDEIDLVWIWHTQNHEAFLNAYDYTNITLDGNTYSSAEDFVVAFNAAVAAIGSTTTTTTIPITTTTTIPATTTTTTIPATTTTTTIPATTTTTTIPATTTTTTAGTLKNNLISVWELDETSGTTGVDAHGSNDLTNSGFTVNQTGKLDKAYLGNGGSTHLINGDILDTVPAAFSISTWFKTPATLDVNVIFTKQNVQNQDRMIFLFDGTDKKVRMDYEVNNGGYQLGTYGPTILSTSTWYHAVLMWSNTTGLKIYLDGVSEVAVPSLTTMMNNASGSFTDFGVGTGVGVSYIGYNLISDQTAFWERELTTGEISQLYNSSNGLAYINW